MSSESSTMQQKYRNADFPRALVPRCWSFIVATCYESVSAVRGGRFLQNDSVLLTLTLPKTDD